MSQPVTQSNTTVRSGAFDWLRCWAAIGVVLLHASAPYFLHRMPGLTWPVFDQPSVLANYLGWGIELFIMPLFLLIAGFFTPGMYRKYEGWSFVTHRARRLLVPLVVAIILILPADLYIWLTGWLIEGLIEPRKIQSLKFDAGVDDGLWGLSHLWFLLYLFTYGVVIAIVRKLKFSSRPGERTGKWWMAAIIAFAWLVLLVEPQVVFGFQHAFLPIPSKWLYSGTYFLGGIWIAESGRLENKIAIRWRMLLMVGGLSMIGGVYCGNRMLAGDDSFAVRVFATQLTVIAAWGVSLAAVGWATQSRIPTSRSLRYFAAASFWVYLVHHPIVALAHIQLKVMFPDMSSTIKMFIAASVAIAFSLLTFEVLIRRWPFAQWLGTPHEFVKSESPRLLQFGHRSADTAIQPVSSSVAAH